MRRLSTTLSLAALVLAAAPPVGADGETGQQGQTWNLGTQQSGRRFNTEVSAFNQSCRGARDFSVAIEGEVARFLRITGPTVLEGIRRGETKSTPAVLDLTAAPAGVYDGGHVVIRCLDCPPNCHLDYQRITILLTVVAPPGAAPPEAPAAAPPGVPAGASSTAADHPDPNGDCAFLPRVQPTWEGAPGGDAPAIVERDGTHVVDLSPSSRLWRASHAATTTAATGSELGSQARELCLEHLAPCDELLARVRAAEEAWRLAEARARDATRQETYDQREADALDEATERDRAYAATLRRQAADWRQLADDAEADAAVNRDRARRQPDYADSWNREAERDEARARERDRNAERLEQEADRIEARIRDTTDRAEETRGRAEAARQAAAAAKQAMDLARAEYEACLERQRLECERQRREAVLAALRSQAAAAAASRPPASGGGSTPGGTAPPPTRAPHSNYESLPVQTAPFCEWIRYDVPYGESADRVRVVALSGRDTPSSLEVREMASGTRSTGKGFEYHCKAATGSAVILFEQVSGEVKRYKLRIGCIPK